MADGMTTPGSAHELFRRVSPTLPSDYADHGGDVTRWERGDIAYPDCSEGCRHAVRLDADWLVCGKVNGPRRGLVTYEHQAGHGCFEPGPPVVETLRDAAFRLGAGG